MKTWTIMAAVVAVMASATHSGSTYVRLDAEGSALRTAFNEAQGKVRVVAYVAPTCGGCLRGAKHLQEHVLDRLSDPRLEVIVAWVPKNGARERHVEPVLGLVHDRRARQFWDEHGFVVDALDERLGLTGRACAGAFLVFGPGAVWTAGEPPSPAYWSDAHAAEFQQHGARFDPDRLLAEVTRLLAEVRS